MRYNIIYWSNDCYTPEIIDEAEGKVEALNLVKEYRLAFQSNNISFQRM